MPWMKRFKNCSSSVPQIFNYLRCESHSVVSSSLGPYGLYRTPWNSPGQNTGVCSLSLLQGIFPTQGSNPGLPQCRQILYHLSHHNTYNKCCLYLYQAKGRYIRKAQQRLKHSPLIKELKNMKEKLIGLMRSRQNPELYLEI